MSNGTLLVVHSQNSYAWELLTRKFHVAHDEQVGLLETRTLCGHKGLLDAPYHSELIPTEADLAWLDRNTCTGMICQRCEKAARKILTQSVEPQ